MLHENYDFDGCYAPNRERIKQTLLAAPNITYNEYGYTCIHIHELHKLYNCELISVFGNKGKVVEINTSRCKHNGRDINVHIKIEWENGKISDIIENDFIDLIEIGKIEIK